ncbi:MAG TPA: HupE/UreJ family protein [Archangium sp.]|nr:HupE/UreJ family protein [Archangium sp.]
MVAQETNASNHPPHPGAFRPALSWLVLAVVLVGLGSRTAALAHGADIVFVRLERPARGTVVESVSLTASTAAGLGIDPSGVESAHRTASGRLWARTTLSTPEGVCALKDSSASVRETYVELTGRFECGEGPLSQTFSFLAALPPGLRVIVESGPAGARTQTFATRELPTLSFAEPSAEAPRPSLTGWVKLGLFHIFTGWDHLAFLFALLLVGTSPRQVLVMITAFTVAHSLTLGLTALGFIVLEERHARWVEVTIAASIIWVGVENLLRQEQPHRAAATFAFGLLHGFGFASVLESYGLGDSAAHALFGFNLGVELGQACVASALFPLLHLLRRRPRALVWTVRTCSLLLLVAGSYWMTERLLG